MRKLFTIALAGTILVSCTKKPKRRVRLAKDRQGYSREEGRHFQLSLLKARDLQLDKLKGIADSYLGIPYLLGGETTDGIDCSAFTQQVFDKTYRIKLPRRAVWQSTHGVFIYRFALRKGDLVFFGPNPTDIDHVGIYMGEGQFINATSSKGVMYSGLDERYWAKKYQFAKRIIF
jgi:hypothetical protein